MKNNPRSQESRLLFAIVLIISLVLIVGCGPVYPSTQEYRIGTEGVVVEFSDSNPSSVYEKEDFGSYIMINNKGSYDVTTSNPGRLLMTYDTYRLSSEGAAAGIIELTGIALQGKNKVYPLGENYPFEVYFQSNILTHLRESSTTSINYNLCYPYSTQLSIMTCIDTKTSSRDVTVKPCQVQTYNGAKGQGAPIVISKIVPEILLQNKYVRPQFNIYIENVGGGYVTNSATCDKLNVNDAQSASKVNVRAWLSSKEKGVELQCGPTETKGILRLIDSESYIRCFLPQNADGYSIAKQSYVTPLIVEIQYTYESIYKQDIEILRNNALDYNTTQGLCASYQQYDNGKCISKCEYCANNPGSTGCYGLAPYDGFKVEKGFSCSCNIDTCNNKQGKGSCIKQSYCAGDLYCCSTQKCDQYQVEYKGQCIDKCDYCRDDNPEGKDTQICAYGFDFTGFRCESINATVCNQLAGKKGCIAGYCGGSNLKMYCADLSKI